MSAPDYFAGVIRFSTDGFLDGFYGETNFADSHMFEYKQFIQSGSDLNGIVEPRGG